MGKIITTLFLVILFTFFSRPAYAEKVAGSSATILSSNSTNISTVNAQNDLYVKKHAIKNLMERYHSPMISSLDAFISTCQTYELNCYLLPSIAILESTFGQFIYPGSHNAFGWGGGLIMYDTWDGGIEAVGRGIRLNYINKGALTIDQIGSIYSESPTWAARVRNIEVQFEREEEQIRLYLKPDAVQL